MFEDWDPEQVIALAAVVSTLLVALATIVNGAIRQGHQNEWEATQERTRHAWEESQASARQDWEESQRIASRWDEEKQRLYVDLYANSNGVLRIQDELVDINRDLSDDLTNRMYMIEEVLQEAHDSDYYKAREAGTESDFMTKIYESELKRLKDARNELRDQRRQLSSALEASAFEISLIAPTQIVDLTYEMVAGSQNIYEYEVPTAVEEKRKTFRNRYLTFVRQDLKISEQDG